MQRCANKQAWYWVRYYKHWDAKNFLREWAFVSLSWHREIFVFTVSALPFCIWYSCLAVIFLLSFLAIAFCFLYRLTGAISHHIHAWRLVINRNKLTIKSNCLIYNIFLRLWLWFKVYTKWAKTKPLDWTSTTSECKRRIQAIKWSSAKELEEVDISYHFEFRVISSKMYGIELFSKIRLWKLKSFYFMFKKFKSVQLLVVCYAWRLLVTVSKTSAGKLSTKKYKFFF